MQLRSAHRSKLDIWRGEDGAKGEVVQQLLLCVAPALAAFFATFFTVVGVLLVVFLVAVTAFVAFVVCIHMSFVAADCNDKDSRFRVTMLRCKRAPMTYSYSLYLTPTCKSFYYDRKNMPQFSMVANSDVISGTNLWAATILRRSLTRYEVIDVLLFLIYP